MAFFLLITNVRGHTSNWPKIKFYQEVFWGLESISNGSSGVKKWKRAAKGCQFNLHWPNRPSICLPIRFSFTRAWLSLTFWLRPHCQPIPCPKGIPLMATKALFLLDRRMVVEKAYPKTYNSRQTHLKMLTSHSPWWWNWHTGVCLSIHQNWNISELAFQVVLTTVKGIAQA